MRFNILYFTDVGEISASEDSARDIHGVLPDSELFPLSKNNWKERLLKTDKNSICFLSSHGDIGENGVLAEWLEKHGYKHTHSLSSVCSLLSNKHKTKVHYCKLGIPTPAWRHGKFNSLSNDKNYFLFKKKIDGGSKMGISRVSSGDLSDANYNNRFIYEQAIDGRVEISVATLRDLNGTIVLPPIVRERMPRTIGKYSDKTPVVKKELLIFCEKYALKIAESLTCFGIIKTDFVIDSNNNIWALETDAQPGLARHNATAKAAKKARISYKKLIAVISTNLCNLKS